MYALRERRVHVTQEDFEMAVAKVGARGEVTLGAQSVLGGICQEHRQRGCHCVSDMGEAVGTQSLEAAEPSLCRAEPWSSGVFGVINTQFGH